MTLPPPHGVIIRGPVRPGDEAVLTPEALAFLAALVRGHRGTLATLLQRRKDLQSWYDGGKLPVFLSRTEDIRRGDWRVAPVPAPLLDRRVEITGPVDRKMIINALNSGASVFMADFEDATSPTWANLLDGQANLRDAVRGTISYEHSTKGTYRLVDRPAVLFVRPRGLHLPEAHLLIDGQPCPGSLFDFGLFLFHNARAQLDRGQVPAFYLPKLEGHLEAKWWNDVFVDAQQRLGLPQGTIKATVLVETLPASFQIEEILYQLRDHSAGLNCGRWDYIFSYIKTVRAHPEFLLPDRSDVTMTQPMMLAYTTRVIQVCHRRGAHAMGGMAAQIPIKDDATANEAALAKVRADKLREVQAGHDGTWVAHPALVPIAKAIFDEHMPGPHQLDRQRDDTITAGDLLRVPKGKRTEEGLRHNIRVGIQYLEAWLAGNGCVPLYHLMEDAATAEISRAQLWQWLHHRAALDDGRHVTPELFRALHADELSRLAPSPTLELASRLFVDLCTAEELPPFLTLAAYDHLTTFT